MLHGDSARDYERYGLRLALHVRHCRRSRAEEAVLFASCDSSYSYWSEGDGCLINCGYTLTTTEGMKLRQGFIGAQRDGESKRFVLAARIYDRKRGADILIYGFPKIKKSDTLHSAYRILLVVFENYLFGVSIFTSTVLQ